MWLQGRLPLGGEAGQGDSSGGLVHSFDWYAKNTLMVHKSDIWPNSVNTFEFEFEFSAVYMY